MSRSYRVEGAIEFETMLEDDDKATGTMEIVPGILNPFGTVHAGALIWFADVVATTLALGGEQAALDMESFPVAVTLSAQLLGNRKAGKLVATATWVRRGRRISTIRTLVGDEDGKALLDFTSTHVSAR
jgi:1,4-dihydroxy-2-naphthoyl-CoA hydrolase